MPKDRINEAAWSDKYKHWTIKVQRDGQRKSFYSSTPGRRGKLEAERKADAWLKKEPATEKPAVLFRDLRDGYLADLGTDNGSAHKEKEASIIRNWLTPWWENKPVAELTQQDYKDAVRRPAETDPPHSARTCGHVRSTITGLWHYARKARIPMDEPLDLTILSGASQGERTILQPDDIRKLFDSAMDRYFHVPVFRFIVVTGFRRGEVCGLETADLDGDLLTVSRAVNSDGEITKGKNKNAARPVFLPQLALDAISLHQQHIKQKGLISPWLFCNTEGNFTHPNTLYRRWLYFRDRYGLASASLHELRHTMISVCKDDMPLTLLKMVAGHSEAMNTLGQYGHDVNGERERAAALIGQIYGDLLKS